MSSKFYFASPNDSSTSLSSTSSDLPFPTALPRSDFLTPDFNPSTYLTSLGHRHQTLEDLRSELRTRSQLLNQELLDLVNVHYADFLGLGISLKGGEEKIEELRVGVLGFQRDLETVQKDILKKEKEVCGWLQERAKATREIVLGKLLLDIHERVQRLEHRLMLNPPRNTTKGITSDFADDFGQSDSSEEEHEEEVEGDDVGTLEITIKRLERRITDFKLIKELSSQVGDGHPLLRAYEPRFTKIQRTLKSDVRTLLKQVENNGSESSVRALTIAVMYGDLKSSE